MADEIPNPATPVVEATAVPAAAPEAAAPAPAPITLSPEEASYVQQRIAEADYYRDHVQPYMADIKPLLEDENRRELWRNTNKSYETLQAERARAQGEEIPGWARPLVDDLQAQKSERARQQQAEQKRFIDENGQYAARLMAEHPHLKENNARGLVQLGAFADALANLEGKPVGLEEAWKRLDSFGARPAAPPPSLRADAGTAGIPDRTKSSGNERYKTDFHGALVDELKRAKSAS